MLWAAAELNNPAGGNDPWSEITEMFGEIKEQKNNNQYNTQLCLIVKLGAFPHAQCEENLRD